MRDIMWGEGPSKGKRKVRTSYPDKDPAIGKGEITLYYFMIWA